MIDPTIATVSIILIATAYTLSSTWISKNIGKPQRIKEIQANFNQINKDLEVASKNKDEKAINDIIKRQEAAMPTMFEMMALMYIPLIAIIPLLILFANPQLNFNENYIFTWQEGAIANLSISNQTQIVSAMGLAPGTTMHYANGSVLFMNGGQTVASMQKVANMPSAVFTHDGPTIHASLRNESGIEKAYFPSTRLYNPVAVQNVFKGFVITLPFYLPAFIQNLFDFNLMFSDFNKYLNWRNTFGPYGFFWVAVLFAGLAISIINSIREKYGKKKTDSPSATPGKT